jgi:hypothetical protein
MPLKAKKSSGKDRFCAGRCRIEKSVCYTIFIAPSCSLLLFQASYYSIYFILCILNKKKKNFDKYIGIYKKGKFVFYASFRHNQAARRSRAVWGTLPDTSTAARLRALLKGFTCRLRPVLVSGRSWNKVVGKNARRPDKAGGSYGIGFVTAHCFILCGGFWDYGFSFSFAFQSGRRSACGTAVVAGKRCGYGIWGECITLRQPWGELRKA